MHEGFGTFAYAPGYDGVTVSGVAICMRPGPAVVFTVRLRSSVIELGSRVGPEGPCTEAQTGKREEDMFGVKKSHFWGGPSWSHLMVYSYIIPSFNSKSLVTGGNEHPEKTGLNGSKMDPPKMRFF